MHRHLGDAEKAQGLSQPSLAFGAMRLVVGGGWLPGAESVLMNPAIVEPQ